MRSTPTLAPCEPALSISMLDDLVVVRPRRRLDRCGTETLVMAVAGATHSGATVLVDLSGSAEPSAAEPLRRPLPSPEGGSRSHPGSSAIVTAAGCVQLAYDGRCWTLDLAARRFCRSSAPVLPSFVLPEHWTAMTSIWVAPGLTTLVTPDGTLVSAPVGWDHDAAAARRRRRATSAPDAA